MLDKNGREIAIGDTVRRGIEQVVSGKVVLGEDAMRHLPIPAMKVVG